MSINILLSGDNDNVLQLAGLKNGIDELFINDATVTATINDSSGADIPGMTWPAAMTYISASDGSYQLLLDSALNLQKNTIYTVHIHVISGGLTGHWTQHIRATARSRSC